ncbi:hypothetical protein [uncultured Tateyamaria sp.]|uniref:hypothetical protein n=1 Tax=uncultured Tateyamaria sp. TaxID=455651 RepID=UPI002616A8EA|nr:hypothetical protein [uncultured Tateyamaria sp.]
MPDTMVKTRKAKSDFTQLEVAAEAELGKFLAIAKIRQDAGKGENYMPGGLIDEVWHGKLKDKTVYAKFCQSHTGKVLAHNPNAGFGTLEWVSDYESRFGPLHKVWFADVAGRIDTDGLAEYRRTGTYITSWDCTPDSGENDHEAPDGGGDYS